MLQTPTRRVKIPRKEAALGLILILALAGVAAYFSLVQKGNSETTSSQSGTSVSAAPINCTGINPNLSIPTGNIDETFGNFSSMTVKITSSGFGGTASYSVLGTPRVNGTSFYVVSMDVQNSFTNETGVVWWNPEGNATLVSQEGQNISGSEAESIGGLLGSAFSVPLGGVRFADMLVSTGIAAAVNSSTLDLGPSSVTVTNYVLGAGYSLCGTSVTSLSFQIGPVPGSNGGEYMVTQLAVMGKGTNGPFYETFKMSALSVG